LGFIRNFLIKDYIKIPVQFIIGLTLGFAAYFAYDFSRVIQQQVELAGVQGKVDAALSLCPAAFVNVIKKEEGKK
jgi:hypothetical protein